jgi:flagellar biosynthetic protein FliP
MSVRRIFFLLFALALLGTLAAAQEVSEASVAGAIDGAATVAADIANTGVGVSDTARELVSQLGGQRMSTAVEIAILLTVLSLLPAILITITSFTRIVIVLSFVRRALSTNELPPNPVIIGLSLFLTTIVMAPVAERIQEQAWKPYQAGTANLEQAGAAAWTELSAFLVANTRQSELDLFRELAHNEQSEGAASAQLPLRVVVPAFVLSELKTSFQMGFLLFLPFLVIDLVVSSVLLSMGMFMLPPVMVSTPIKILLFVMVDGWHLVCQSLVTSFVTS